MSNIMVGLLCALGVAAWIYSKVMRRTGGNNSNSLVAAAMAGAATLIIILTLLAFLDNYLTN